MRSTSPSVPRSGGAVLAEGRVLAIDYGRKRIGLAVSDELGLTANALEVLDRKNRRADVHYLRKIVQDRKIRLIVVGRPIHLSGDEGDMALEASKFAARLRKELGVEVKMIDERLTSWEARQLVAERNGPRRSRIDDVAAAILLREYLDSQKQVARKASAESSQHSGVGR